MLLHFNHNYFPAIHKHLGNKSNLCYPKHSIHILRSLQVEVTIRNRESGKVICDAEQA